MGPAHSTVVNRTTKPVCVITFNMADLIYKSYHSMYIIEPGESCVVEANPDAIGLKVGIVYETHIEKQALLFHRFTCNNESTLTLTSVEEDDLTFSGEGAKLVAKGQLRESNVEPFNMAADTLRLTLAPEPEESRAEEKIKQFVQNVKESSETLIKNVADTSGNIVKTVGIVVDSGLVRVGLEGRLMGSSAPTTPIENNDPGAKRSEFMPEGQDLHAAAASKWEADLQRLKREQQWEAELQRIKQERLEAEAAAAAEAQREQEEREREIEEKRRRKKREMEARRAAEEAAAAAPPVVDNVGCKMCTIS